RAFDKGVTGPDLAGIMGDRNHRYTSLHCEARTTRLIAADKSGRHSRTFGKHNGPTAFLQLSLALRNDLLHGAATVVSVDSNHLQQCEAPAKEGHQVKFALIDKTEFPRHVSREKQ